jgi:hypothetical protein
VWCGALAGVAGVMLAARLQSGQPTAGEFYELTAIAAVVLGGAALQGGEGTLYKSVIGVFIMIVLGNALNLLNVDSYWQRVAVGAVIIAGRRKNTLSGAGSRQSVVGQRGGPDVPSSDVVAALVLPASFLLMGPHPDEDRHRRLAPRTTIRSTSPCCAASAPARRSSAGRGIDHANEDKLKQISGVGTWSRAA